MAESLDDRPGTSQTSPASAPGNTVRDIRAEKCAQYDITHHTDKYYSWIYGLSITPDGRRLLADLENSKIKLFFRDMMEMISSLTMPGNPPDKPCRIAVTGDREAVVSVDETKLYILDISGQQLSISRTVELSSFSVLGIATYKDRLVVTSLDPSPSVKRMNHSGEVDWSTSTDQQGQQLFSEPWYVACYDDGKSSTVIVTDRDNHTLTVLDSNTGSVISRRRVEEKGPAGVTTDTAGNIYVCYSATDELAVLTRDLTEEKILLTRRDGISRAPLAIVYDAEDHRLLVSNVCKASRNASGTPSCNFVDCFQLL